MFWKRVPENEVWLIKLDSWEEIIGTINEKYSMEEIKQIAIEETNKDWVKTWYMYFVGLNKIQYIKWLSQI